MPDPSAARAHLSRLVGRWVGEETMHPSEWDPKGSSADGLSDCREALGGFAVVVDYQQSKGGQPAYSGHGIYTWDAGAEEVVLHWFDSMGSPREEFRGKWDGGILAITSKNSMGFARLTYDHSKEGELISRMEMGPSLDAMKVLFDGRYRRES